MCVCVCVGVCLCVSARLSVFHRMGSQFFTDCDQIFVGSSLRSRVREKFLQWFDRVIFDGMGSTIYEITDLMDFETDCREWRTWLDFFPQSFSSFYFLPLFHCHISILLFPCASVWGKHSCMSSPFSIAILNGPCPLRARILFCGDVPAIKQLNYKQTLSRYKYCVSWILDINIVNHWHISLKIILCIVDTRPKKICIMDTGHKYFVSWRPDLKIVYHR